MRKGTTREKERLQGGGKTSASEQKSSSRNKSNNRENLMVWNVVEMEHKCTLQHCARYLQYKRNEAFFVIFCVYFTAEHAIVYMRLFGEINFTFRLSFTWIWCIPCAHKYNLWSSFLFLFHAYVLAGSIGLYSNVEGCRGGTFVIFIVCIISISLQHQFQL